MSNKLKPYSDYKDPGLSWLGKVPSHWQRIPLFAITRIKNIRERPDLPLLSVYRDYGVIPRDSRDDNYNPKSADLSPYKVVSPGDLVLNKMKTWQGSLGVSEHLGIVSPAYIVCELYGDLDRKYIHHLLRSKPYIGHYNQLSFGVRVNQWDMRYDDFKRIPMFLPPREEQSAISRFVQAQNYLTRRYIRTKQRLIDLLEEQKQALIQRAVTRGFHTSISLVDTEIPWLPSVAKEWSITKLGHFIHILTGYPFQSEGFSQAPDHIRLLRGINIAPGSIRWESVVRWSRSELDDLREYLLEPGDLVFGMDRPIINDGVRVAIVQEKDIPCLLLQRVARLRTNENLDTEFLYLLLQSKIFKDYLAPIFTGISVPHVSSTQISSFRFGLPSLAMQKSIVSQVNSLSERIDNSIDGHNKQIDLIQEYRTRLIADVVTGKLDVRGLALPDLDAAVSGAAASRTQ